MSKLIAEKKERKKPGVKTSGAIIKTGSFVRIINQESEGQVISVQGKEAEVAFGQLKIRVGLDRLEPVKPGSRKKSKESEVHYKPDGIDINEKMQHFSNTLDLRGMRGEEAVRDLDQYLDQALLLNKKEIKILHGKGNGILRKLVREQLLRYSFIDDIKDEHADRGGSGITLVILK